MSHLGRYIAGVWLACTLLSGANCLTAADQTIPKHISTERGDKLLAQYFQLETARLQNACLAEIHTADDWLGKRDAYRQQLLEMLGLDPLPERTDLQPVVTGTLQAEDFIVENLHFQSRPGLYVTANLYRPKTQDKPLPGVLYVCGHGREAKNGISYGNKTHYQHHGAWLARNGYVCLMIDTLQLGEIEGLHHGTHNLNQWWWLNRGYTPAGVEAWNSVRALDYLQSRKEVDSNKLGVTGRSGGGAYSWWTAALDDRIKCAIPVAGITDLQNHVVDGCVDGHCDCMYMVNTYRWDYPQVAALVSPRPLLISNTDSDRIFPLDGVVRTFEQVRRIYRLQNAEPVCGLNITAGQHVDTQELQIHALRWLDQHLKAEPSRLIETAAVKYFEIEQLKVFAELPTDEINTTIQDKFVPLAAAPEVPADQVSWNKQRDHWLTQLKEKTFRGWPSDHETPPLDLKKAWSAEHDTVQMTAYDYTSQQPFHLRLYVVHRANLKKPEKAVIHVVDEEGWSAALSAWTDSFSQELAEELAAVDENAHLDVQNKATLNLGEVRVFLVPRGIGLTAFDSNPKKQIQLRRRFYLLGQTLDGMQIWDLRRGLQAVRQIPALSETPIELEPDRLMSWPTLYASLFEPPIARLTLKNIATESNQGPILLNVDRIWSMPAAVASAAERSPLRLIDVPALGKYPQDVATQLGWDKHQLEISVDPAK